MQGVSLTPRARRTPSNPLPISGHAVWPRLVLCLFAATDLLTALAGGPLLIRAAPPALASSQPAGGGVPMLGVDPGRSGSQPGPLPATVPAHLWDAFAGVGAHPPAVVDGVAFVATDDGELVAFDAAGGTERWRVAIGGSDTPTVVDGVVYVSAVTDSETGNSGGFLIALDAISGAELWRAPTGTFGGASPVVVDGVAYAGGDQELYAFDAMTGQQLWVFALDAEPCTCTPVRAAVAGGLVLVIPGSQAQASLFAVDARTGEERWRHDADLAPFTAPVVADNLVFVGSDPIRGMDGGEAGTGRFVALDLSTGEEVWSLAADAAAPPAVAAGSLYLQTRNPGGDAGTLRAIVAATGEELWAAPAVEASLAAPSVASGAVVVPAGTREGYAEGFDDVLLTAYDAVTGGEVWTIEVAGSISGPPAIVDGVIYLTTYHEGALFALGEAGPGAATPEQGGPADASGRAACTATATENPYAHQLSGEPLPAVTSPGQGKEGVTGADMPAGEPASDELVAAMDATLAEFANCVGGDPAYLYGFFSDAYFIRARQTMTAEGAAPNAEFAVTRLLPPFSPFADLTLREPRLLADGRAAGIIDGGFNPIFVVFSEQDGRWLINEMGVLAEPSS